MIDLSSKAFGDLGVSFCCTHYIASGYQVLMPFGDRGHYDLVVEKEGVFYRIQSKWTATKKQKTNYFVVSLQVCGTNKQNGALKVVHKYSKSDFDILWVATPEGCYAIPASDVFATSETLCKLALTPKWDKFRVSLPLLNEDAEKAKYSQRLTEDEKSRIDCLISNGMSRKQVAIELGVSFGCINTYLYRKRKQELVNAPIVSADHFG